MQAGRLPGVWAPSVFPLNRLSAPGFLDRSAPSALFHDSSSSRQLFVQVVPYVSELDAASAAPNLPLRMRVPLGTPGEWAIDTPELPGVVGALACERVFNGTKGLEKQMVVVGSIGPIAFITGFIRSDDSQRWDYLVQTAERQAQKVRSYITSEEFER